MRLASTIIAGQTASLHWQRNRMWSLYSSSTRHPLLAGIFFILQIRRVVAWGDFLGEKPSLIFIGRSVYY